MQTQQEGPRSLAGLLFLLSVAPHAVAGPFAVFPELVGKVHMLIHVSTHIFARVFMFKHALRTRLRVHVHAYVHAHVYRRVFR